MDPAAETALAFCHRALARLARVEEADEAGREAGAPVAERAEDADADADAAIERSLDGLVVDYGVLEAEQWLPVRRSHLSAAGLAPEALHDVALANLTALVLARAEVHHYGRIHAVLLGADLEASVLLCAPFWDDWQAALAPGGFVAAIPGRDVLAFGDATSAAALRELDDLCTRMAPAVDAPLSERLWRRMDGQWRPLGEP
jgi:hypothetical protein